MPVPVCILIGLCVRGSALEGAQDGVKQFIWSFNSTQLQSTDIWSDAVGTERLHSAD